MEYTNFPSLLRHTPFSPRLCSPVQMQDSCVPQQTEFGGMGEYSNKCLQLQQRVPPPNNYLH